MRFRTLVEPPEPVRGLEVPPERVEALGGKVSAPPGLATRRRTGGDSLRRLHSEVGQATLLFLVEPAFRCLLRLVVWVVGSRVW